MPHAERLEHAFTFAASGCGFRRAGAGAAWFRTTGEVSLTADLQHEPGALAGFVNLGFFPTPSARQTSVPPDAIARVRLEDVLDDEARHALAAALGDGCEDEEHRRQTLFTILYSVVRAGATPDRADWLRSRARRRGRRIAPLPATTDEDGHVVVPRVERQDAVDHAVIAFGKAQGMRRRGRRWWRDGDGVAVGLWLQRSVWGSRATSTSSSRCTRWSRSATRARPRTATRTDGSTTCSPTRRTRAWSSCSTSASPSRTRSGRQSSEPSSSSAWRRCSTR